MPELIRDDIRIPLSERATRRRVYIGENITPGDVVYIRTRLHGNVRGTVLEVSAPEPTCGYDDRDRNICAPWVKVRPDDGRIPSSALATQID